MGNRTGDLWVKAHVLLVVRRLAQGTNAPPKKGQNDYVHDIDVGLRSVGKHWVGDSNDM